MKKIYAKLIALSLILSAAILLTATGCSNKQNRSKSIAVFIPGIIADSPTYARVAEGTSKAVETFNSTAEQENKVTLKIIEAGTTQSEWGPKITALCAEKKYDLIVSSNPSLPQLCIEAGAMFPEQKFLLLDAYCEGNSQIASVSYDQRTQAFLNGYISALVTKTGKIGLIAAQEYPVMNNIILPYYIKGAEAALPAVSVDFRIVGNWYDATKGAELARAMISSGTDVILPICGGASQGVIAAAKESGISLTWFDEEGFYRAPGTIIACSEILQNKTAEEAVLEYLNGGTEFGTVKTVGTISDGYMNFSYENEEYKSTLPEECIKKTESLIKSLKDGTFLIDPAE